MKILERMRNNKNITKNLKNWNLALAVLHGVQAILIFILSGNSSVPVTTSYLTLDTLLSRGGEPALVPATRVLFNVNLTHLVVVFLLLSAVAHLIIATIYRSRYEADIKRGINRARWVEYGFSASTMIVAIALLSGVYDLSSLLMLFTLIFTMNMMGLAMELWNRGTKKPNWFSYVIGCVAGIIPWLAIAIYLWGANIYGSGQVPTFVYWIYLSIFLFFNCFAVNMYLQYQKKGKWADYLYGEKVYMILSLVAKSALAWQVFAGTLRP